MTVSRLSDSTTGTTAEQFVLLLMIIVRGRRLGIMLSSFCETFIAREDKYMLVWYELITFFFFNYYLGGGH